MNIIILDYFDFLLLWVSFRSYYSYYYSSYVLVIIVIIIVVVDILSHRSVAALRVPRDRLGFRVLVALPLTVGRHGPGLLPGKECAGLTVMHAPTFGHSSTRPVVRRHSIR
jgi:hypothetical protein